MARASGLVLSRGTWRAFSQARIAPAGALVSPVAAPPLDERGQIPGQAGPRRRAREGRLLLVDRGRTHAKKLDPMSSVVPAVQRQISMVIV